MMNNFMLICTDPTKNSDELLSKLKTNPNWELTLDAGNVVPGSAPSFRIDTNLSHGEVLAALTKLFQEPLFFAVEFHKL